MKSFLSILLVLTPFHPLVKPIKPKILENQGKLTMYTRVICLIFTLAMYLMCETGILYAQQDRPILDQRIEQLSSRLVNSIPESSDKVKIAVIDFAQQSTLKPDQLGQFIASIISVHLFNSGRVEIFERKKLNDLLTEHNFQMSDLFDEDKRKEIKFDGVDALVLGEHWVFGFQIMIKAQLVDIESANTLGIDNVYVPLSDIPIDLLNLSVPAPTKKASKAKPTNIKKAKVSASYEFNTAGYPDWYKWVFRETGNIGVFINNYEIIIWQTEFNRETQKHKKIENTKITKEYILTEPIRIEPGEVKEYIFKENEDFRRRKYKFSWRRCLLHTWIGKDDNGNEIIIDGGTEYGTD